MPKLRITSEAALVRGLLNSTAGKDFRGRLLSHKIDRERQGRELLLKWRGKYTEAALNAIFDKVDLGPSGARLFGFLLGIPNRNLMFASGVKQINTWIRELLFSGHQLQDSLRRCSNELAIKGAGKGLATLLLYLMRPLAHNVWLPSTEEGLRILKRIPQKKESAAWGSGYAQFNKAACKFRDEYGLQPQEIDWIFWRVKFCVEAHQDYFLIDSDYWNESGRGESERSVIDVEQTDLTDAQIDKGLRANRLRFGIIATGNERALVRQRRGQARLRKLAIENYGGRCAVCDISDQALLIASHVVGWAEAPEHRGNLSNVICVCRIHDALFEAGYWSLGKTLRILKKKSLSSRTVTHLLAKMKSFREPLQFRPDPRFLAHHREKAGFGP